MRRNTCFKFSAGRYSQNLVAANSDRDVVNLFYGFLSGADDLPSEFNGKPLSTKLQTADHLVFGGEWNVVGRWTLELEGYVKRFNQITNVNRYKIYDDIPVYESQPERLRKDFYGGNRFGARYRRLADLRRQALVLLGVYSLGKVTRFDGVTTYAPQFDRRHNVNLWMAFKGEKDWGINLRWNFGSGFPSHPSRATTSFNPSPILKDSPLSTTPTRRRTARWASSTGT